MASSESSVTLLASVIKQLSSSDDVKSREFEKEKIQLDLKKADEKLAELVEENQDHLKKTIQSFGSVVTRVTASRNRIKVLHEKLSRCRTLLHCNREDLKTHWQEGLECTEKLSLLDKIEKAIAVPEKLDRYIARKHFLHASELLTETVENLDGNLVNVEALRDLRASLHSRKAVLHETIIDELNKQIYTESQKHVKKNISSDTNTAAFKRIIHGKSHPKVVKNDEIPYYTDEELYEDLQRDPEEDPALFTYVMVKALVVLDKVPEAVEAFKGRTKRDMMMIIRRATDQVVKRSIESRDAVTIEEMAIKINPQVLLELLEVTFERFRSVAMNHSILLAALEQAKLKMPEQKAKDLNLYTKEDIWSKIQFAIKDMLHPYLDIQNLSTPQQALTSFGSSDSAVAQFFTAKKRLTTSYTKPKRFHLFKFECSSSSEALHSYMREQDLASSLPEDTYADFIVWNAPQLLCKPQAKNITAVFIPVMEFVNEIDQKTSSTLGTTGVLHHFVGNFVQKVFLDQILYEVSEKASAVTKGHDALRNLCDSNTQKDLLLPRPLLKSAIVIYHITEDLLLLIKKVPQYCNDFLDITIRTLNEYLDSCNLQYKSLVLREGDGKVSRIISANWVRDEDISRLLMSLPNWASLQAGNKQGDIEDEATLQAIHDREASLLINNLEKAEIEKNQVILDSLDLKSLANLQESLEWLSDNIRTFVINIAAQSTGINVSSLDSTDNIMPPQIHPSSDDSIRALSDLAEKFKELSNNCILLLHLEIRCHCFYYLGKATRESSFVCHMDSIEIDVQIPQMVKDLRDIEDLCVSALVPRKIRYLFDGLSYLLASIIISSTSYIKKINRNGVKKMCQNIFTIQQELANIMARREINLDLARQYFELLFLTPDEILNMIHEQGSRFKEQDYSNALELLSRSEVPFNKDLWKVRRSKLSEILKEVEKKKT